MVDELGWPAYMWSLVRRAAPTAWGQAFGLAGGIAVLLIIAAPSWPWLRQWTEFVDGLLVVYAFVVLFALGLSISAWRAFQEQRREVESLTSELTDKRDYRSIARSLEEHYKKGLHKVSHQIPMDVAAHQSWLEEKLQWEQDLHDLMVGLDCPEEDISEVWHIPIDNIQRRVNNPMLLQRDMLDERLSRLKAVKDKYFARSALK